MLKWGKQNHDVDVAMDRGAATIEESVTKQKAAIAKAKEAAGEVQALGFTAMTVAAARWIDANPPKHASQELDGKPFELLTKAWYSIGSSYTHDYSWTLNILDSQENQHGLVADLLISAVLATETAIALFEAQMLAPGEQWQNEHLPARLGPTISEWAPRFQTA